MKIKNKKQEYLCPEAAIFEVKAEGVICSSTDVDGVDLDFNPFNPEETWTF